MCILLVLPAESIQSLYLVVPSGSAYFLFPNAQVPKAGRRVNGIKFWQYTEVLPQEEPASSLFKGLWVYKLAQVRELFEGPMTLSLPFSLDLCSLGQEILCLYRISKNLVGFLSISVLGTDKLGNAIGLCGSEDSDWCFDSAAHNWTIRTLPLLLSDPC